MVNGNLDENYREGCHGLASCNIILDNVIYNFCDKLEKAHVMRIFTFARFQDMVKWDNNKKISTFKKHSDDL